MKKLLFILLFIPTTLYAQVACNDPGLIRKWSFDEGSGTNTFDCVSYDTVTLTGVNWVTGKWGNGIKSFEGITTNCVTSSNTFNLHGVSTFTFSFWVKFTSAPPADTYFFQCGPGYTHFLQYEVPDKKLRMQLANEIGGNLVLYHYGTVLSSNVWYNFVTTYSRGNNIKQYINAVMVASKTVTNNSVRIDEEQSHLFTNRSGVQAANAIYDDWAVWNYAKTDSEVETLYDASKLSVFSVSVFSSDTVRVYFTDTPLGSAVTNYIISPPLQNGSRNPSSVTVRATDKAVELKFSTATLRDVTYTVFAWDITSTSGKIMTKDNYSTFRGVDPTPLFYDDFNRPPTATLKGNTPAGKWDSASLETGVTIYNDITIKRNGACSLRGVDTTASDDLAILYGDFTPTATVYFRMSVYIGSSLWDQLHSELDTSYFNFGDADGPTYYFYTQVSSETWVGGDVNSRPTTVFRGWDGGAFTYLASDIKHNPNTWFTAVGKLNYPISSTDCDYWIDGTSISMGDFDSLDCSAMTTGWGKTDIGVHGAGVVGMIFDDYYMDDIIISSYPLSYTLDQSSPNAVSGKQAVTGSSAGNINLSWTASGDDDGSGNITNGWYRIKWTTWTSYNVEWSTGVWNDYQNMYWVEYSTSVVASQSQKRIVTGLSNSTTYYFNVWLADEQGLWSEASGIFSGQTTTGAVTKKRKALMVTF